MMDLLSIPFSLCCTGLRESNQANAKSVTSNRKNITLSELRNGERFHPTDTYRRLFSLHDYQQGRCTVSRSKFSGNLFVIKRVQMAPSKASDHGRSGRRKPLPIEARVLISKLRPHPNILRLFAVERDPSKYRSYLLYFEYCTGGDLLEQLRKFRALDMPTPLIFTLHVFVGLANALSYIHEGLRHESGTVYRHEARHEPIVHGDIKPDNVFLRWPGRQECGMPDVILGDFGMAQAEEESWGITGTPGYDCPEVLAITKLRDSNPVVYKRARNARIVTRKSDMYQVGLTLYLMAAGKHYKTGDDPQTALDLPEGFASTTGFTAALAWCLQPDPEDRPECTAELEDGFLFAVEGFRKQRDAMFARDGDLEPGVWNVREPRIEKK